MSSVSVEILHRALLREKTARKQAERILEEKSFELYELTQRLEETNKELLEQVNQKNSELKGVFENIIDAFVVIDLFGNVIKMNDAAVNLFGYDHRIEPLNLMNILYQDDYEYTSIAFQELLEKSSFTKYKSRIISKDKSIKHLEVNASLVYNDVGKPIAVQGIARDITEDIRNKKLIEEQKEQLSITFDNSPLGIVLTEMGTLLKFNKAFENFLGYTENELKQSYIQKEVTHPDDLEASAKMLSKLHAGEINSYDLRKRYIKKNGEIFWARLYVNAVRDKNGKIKYEVGLVENISNQIKIETDNKKLLQNLESRNNELQEYAHVVSHDLKSPLRSISALTSWLKEDYSEKLDAEGINNINLIQQTVEKMERFINDILNYSSINKGGAALEDVSIYEVVNHIKGLIFIPKHIEVIANKNLPIIKADKTRMQQLFQNIISNAVNYIDKDKGEVVIKHTEEKDAWIFSIKDNGIGISKKYHKKIFNIFQSMGNHKDSTGIGLSIVKKIVEMYDGEIWLESKENIGTTFYIKLKK